MKYSILEDVPAIHAGWGCVPYDRVFIAPTCGQKHVAHNGTIREKKLVTKKNVHSKHGCLRCGFDRNVGEVCSEILYALAFKAPWMAKYSN